MRTTYKIGEAAAALNLKTYVLRFWETEFEEIVPLRTEKGQRLYTDEHLALLERIRFLLHERGLTIGGARKVLAEEKERGLVYAFGQPGALSPASGLAETGFSLDGNRAGTPEQAGHTPAYPPGNEDGEEDEADQAEEEPDGEADPESFLDGPAAQGRAAGSGSAPARPAQYNLPGLEELVALRAAMAADEQGGRDEAAPPVCAGGPSLAGDAGAPRGMLPLFAVAKAAFFAGRAGGGNFIGAAPGLFAPQPDQELPGMGLNDILAELEAVARLLRRGGPL